MKSPYKARVNSREFLNLPGFHDGAYVVAYVEDTSARGLEEHDYARDGEKYNPRPRLILQIADCSHHIELEVEVESPLRRANSFHKIDTMISALQDFRAGLAEECTQFKRRERLLRAYEMLRDENQEAVAAAGKERSDAPGSGEHRAEDLEAAQAMIDEILGVAEEVA